MFVSYCTVLQTKSLTKNKFLKMKHAKDETIIEYKIKRMKNIRISPFTGTKRVTEMSE